MNIFLVHAFWYYYITFVQFLFVDIVTSEQNKGIVLYSLRNYKLESGMFTGIPLPLFLILIVYIILEPCPSLILFSILSGRSLRSPLQLVSKFPDHPEVGTLHDNFV